MSGSVDRLIDTLDLPEALRTLDSARPPTGREGGQRGDHRDRSPRTADIWGRAWAWWSSPSLCTPNCIRPKDSIIWDVGHQAYAHKLLTGRVREFYVDSHVRGTLRISHQGREPLRRLRHGARKYLSERRRRDDRGSPHGRGAEVEGAESAETDSTDCRASGGCTRGRGSHWRYGL